MVKITSVISSNTLPGPKRMDPDKPNIYIVKVDDLPIRGLDAPNQIDTLSASAPVVYTRSFTNDDLSSGSISSTHNLGTRAVVIQLYNGNDRLVVDPDIGIFLVSTNSISVNFSSSDQLPLSGTWNLVVMG